MHTMLPHQTAKAKQKLASTSRSIIKAFPKSDPGRLRTWVKTDLIENLSYERKTIAARLLKKCAE
jgi:hypothetical protein